MDEKIRILVIDRGFVLVCYCPKPEQYALWLPIRQSRSIRRWGTTEGLGQLCNGPTENTVLDAVVPQESVPIRAILRVIEVEESKWETHLK